MADTSWVKTDFQRELYAKAYALKADSVILSSEVGAKTYVETIERATPAGKFNFKSHFSPAIKFE